MGAKKPLICEIAADTYAINEFGLSAMYLLVGEEKAMLIDTACGACDLKKLVAELTDKPLIVVHTHGHLDHVGGMTQFEEVYLHEADWDMAKNINAQELRDYADSFGKSGGYTVFDYDPEQFPPLGELPRLLPIRDGDTFDLGGRVVEAHHIAGHTPGGMSFLDVKTRIIFSGDCCNLNLLAPWTSVETTLRNMRKFHCLSDRFDRNFNGHVGYLGNLDCCSQKKSVPEDLIHICEAILRGEGEADGHDFLGIQLTQMQYGNAKLSYDLKNLWDDPAKNP